MKPQFVPINDLRALSAAGIEYPKTESQARWLFRRRHFNGLSQTFVRVGRRIFIDVKKYREAVSRSVA